MSDENGFLVAIKAAPDDNTARLVYADWLDERDRPGGDFLRIECELAGVDPTLDQWWVVLGRLQNVSHVLEEEWIAAVCRAAPDRIITPIYVKLPQGWLPRQSKTATVRQCADYPSLDAHFTLMIESPAEWNRDFMAWAEAMKQATARQSKLGARSETDLRQNRIGGQPVSEYEVIGNAGTSRGMARIILLPFDGWFCKVLCWTIPENWNAAQPKFDEVITHLRKRLLRPRG